jgi:hypothetical protein
LYCYRTPISAHLTAAGREKLLISAADLIFPPETFGDRPTALADIDSMHWCRDCPPYWIRCATLRKKKQDNKLDFLGHFSKNSPANLAALAAIGRSCTQAWPPSSIILGTIVFQALGNRARPNHRAPGPEQCGRSRFPKAMRESPLLGHPPQKSQYSGAATPQALLGGIFGRYTPKRNGYICSPPPGHCTGAV